MSRDTAYRVFRDDQADGSVTDAIVAAVAGASTDPVWGGADEALADVLTAYQNSFNAGNDSTSNVIAALTAGIAAQFRSPGHPVGWILQAVALTASDAWEGEPPAEDAVELGRTILADRRSFYDAWTDKMVEFLTPVMSDLGRRPRAGLEPRAIVALLHSLLDGAVLRRLVEPDAFPLELVAEAMYLLWIAFSEVGPADDPRRPDGERNRVVFDRLVEGAGQLWRTKPEITVDDVAIHAGVSPEAAALLFPDLGDLADSFVRAQVVGGGFVDLGAFPDQARARQLLPGLASELRRLSELADTVPHALEASVAHHPTKSKAFADDFVRHQSRLVEALHVTPHAEQYVRDLLAFASQGSAGWASVMALLRTVGFDADTPT